jgi:hypothetical protein
MHMVYDIEEKDRTIIPVRGICGSDTARARR